MKLKPYHYFLGGVALTALIAAARFVGGTPLDQTFTYQGQLRNAGQLVSGPVDLRITLWDSDTAGSQVGSANSFNAMQLTDGRFACGLNFGNAAFDGSNRWIQVEFRNPAGVGQYQTLSPRDKITATPYALYALNGANGVWVYDTNQQSVSVLGKKVGIGTSNPTATLEVVSATGGDDSVKLPVGSVGKQEIGVYLPAAWSFAADLGGIGSNFEVTRTVTIPADGFLYVQTFAGSGCPYFLWDNQALPSPVIPVSAGQHTMRMKRQCNDGAPTTMVVVLQLFNNTLGP
jgi:hypothetical protein